MQCRHKIGQVRVNYLRQPTALRSKPAYRTPCSSKLSAQRGMNLLASPTLCGPRFWKNSNGSETKMKPNNKSLFDCSLRAPRKIGATAPTPKNCLANDPYDPLRLRPQQTASPWCIVWSRARVGSAGSRHLRGPTACRLRQPIAEQSRFMNTHS